MSFEPETCMSVGPWRQILEKDLIFPSPKLVEIDKLLFFHVGGWNFSWYALWKVSLHISALRRVLSSSLPGSGPEPHFMFLPSMPQAWKVPRFTRPVCWHHFLLTGFLDLGDTPYSPPRLAVRLKSICHI